MKELKLNNSEFVTLVDDDIYELIKDEKCYLMKSKKSYKLYATIYKNKKTVMLHSYIMGASEGVMIDHKNGNGLDNQRKNLRYATKSQNMMNKGTRRDNTSGYKGVSFDKGVNKYQAYIWLNGKKTNLGYYKDLKEAATVYNNAAIEYHREFAYLNVVEKE